MADKTNKRILITGAGGQIGTELTLALRQKHGGDQVIASDLRPLPPPLSANGPTEYLDVTNREALAALVRQYQVSTIYHMAAILSASGEEKPILAWNVNIGGLNNVLEVARDLRVKQIFHPSSIAAFGPETPKENTPQQTILRPTTMYGITKVASELLGAYYNQRYNIDVRGIRYPGVISSETLPGGGTTDYAVEIFYEAIRTGHYTCFVREDTVLPMIYMPDCIRATLKLMEADPNRLKYATEYNVAGLSFSAGQLVDEIRKHIPRFTCTFRPDFRQQIADSWPRTINDTPARQEWDWKPQYDLASMVADMIKKLRYKLQ